MGGATLPAYFIEEPVGGQWNEACGITFTKSGRMLVWERAGRVWIVETNGVRSPQPLIDIHDEVGGWRDFGMLGLALDPAFEENGHIYLHYLVDRHHLKNFGTAAYQTSSDEYYQATIGRLTRYTARAADGFRTVDPASRRILVGETIQTGIPSLFQSHGPGSLVFGTDGTLLASCGEGASYNGTDAGGAVGGNYASQALADGIIQTKENVGAYRAQLVDSLGGKIIRINPATGDGVPSNPFFDPVAPRAPRSRVWALGLRNPYRMSLRPGTGSADPADANPGVLYIGDVGWGGWEELNVANRPGLNFGWPIFEGMESQSEYDQARALNRDALNPLYGTGGCSQRYFSFHDLIVADTLTPDPWFPNPCNSAQAIPSSIPRFVHARSTIEWRESARTGAYDAQGSGIFIPLGRADSPVSGPQFAGQCSVGGAWYTGSVFPTEYQNSYFHADFESGWIRQFVFDQTDRLLAVRPFLTNGGGIVALAAHPTDGNLYYVRWGMEVVKITYSLDTNRRPLAVASQDKSFGPGPLAVQFDGQLSSDPEGSPLTYHWDFGDGSPVSTEASPLHTFQPSSPSPTNYSVLFRVTDTNGASATATLQVSVNNTPPAVTIVCPVDGSKYPMTGDTLYRLRAQVSDAEHPDAVLSYEWQTFLHHNDHQHSEPIRPDRTPTMLISPVGCAGETYFFRVKLIVSDPDGLATTNEARIYPDCDEYPPRETFPLPWSQQDIGAVLAAGVSSYSNGVFTVAGSGADIWGNADEFHFSYWNQNGDGQIIARVASQENTQPGAKAGVMIREGLSPGARYAMAAVTPTGLLFQYRTTPGGASSFQIVYDLAPPYWVKLVRSGNSFTGFSSPNGAAWSPMGSATVSMTGPTYGGLAVTSHNDGILSTVLFENVVGIVGSVVAANAPLPAPWLSTDVGPVSLAGGSTHTNGAWTLSSAGEGPGGIADSVRFVYRSWTNDFEFITRLLTLQNTPPWAKAGIMVRESLDPAAPQLALYVTPQAGSLFQSRSQSGGPTDLLRGPGVTAPAWLKILRRGAAFDGAVSSDGVTWMHVGTQSLPVNATVQVGLMVSSFDPSRLTSARFTNITVRPPSLPIDLGLDPANWPAPRTIPRISLGLSPVPGQLLLKFEDHPGQPQRVEWSADLVEWMPIGTLNNLEGVSFFMDAVVAPPQQRFYRVTVDPEP
jgi:glucose/arabinose dehydrogenase/PKD repeat protein